MYELSKTEDSSSREDCNMLRYTFPVTRQRARDTPLGVCWLKGRLFYISVNINFSLYIARNTSQAISEWDWRNARIPRNRQWVSPVERDLRAWLLLIPPRFPRPEWLGWSFEWSHPVAPIKTRNMETPRMVWGTAGDFQLRVKNLTTSNSSLATEQPVIKHRDSSSLTPPKTGWHCTGGTIAKPLKAALPHTIGLDAPS